MNSFEKQNIIDIAKRNKQVGRILDNASKDIAKRFTTVKGKRFASVLEGNIENLREGLKANIEQGIRRHWMLANEMNNKAISGYFQNVKISNDLYQSFRSPNIPALNSFLNRTENGMNLSERVWALGNGAKGEVETFLATGIAEGKSAVVLSKEMTRYLAGKPIQYKGTLLKGKNIEYQSVRLAATETNMAFRMSDYTQNSQLPFVTGVTVQLSASHPQEDICDDLKGTYPKGFEFVGWHPCCLCFATWETLSTEDFVDYLKTGNIDQRQFTTALPANMVNFLKKHGEKLLGYTTPPYWIRGNFSDELKLIQNELMPAIVQIPPVDNITKKNISNMVGSIDVNEGGLGQGWNDFYGCSNNLVSDVLDIDSERLPKTLLPSNIDAVPSFVRHHYIDTKGRYRWLQMYEVPEGLIIPMNKRKEWLEVLRNRLGIPAKEAKLAIEKAELQQKALAMTKDHIEWQLNLPEYKLKENYSIYKERTVRRAKNILLNYDDWDKDRINQILREAKNKGIEHLLVKGKGKWYWKE